MSISDCPLFSSSALLISRSTVFCFQPCLPLRQSRLPLVIELRVHCLINISFCSRPPIEIGGRSGWVHLLLMPSHCFTSFWWRVLLSCRLTQLNFNSAQWSICFKDGIPWRLRSRISSFWTSPGRFRRILGMSKSGVGDVSMKTPPGVALLGGKPRRIYFSCIWQGELNTPSRKHTLSWLSIEW